MIRTYISITDFMTKEQVQNMLAELRNHRAHYTRRSLGVGVMMSWKTLHDQPTKWTAAFPKKEDIADIFVDDPDAFNVLHYADYDNQPLLENLELVKKWGGPRLHAIQLDMIWPDPQQLQQFRKQYPEISIILQVNTKSLAIAFDNPDVVASCLEQYGAGITHVLLDKSMGKGLGMNAHALLPFARAIAQKLPKIGLAAAGGLGPDTLDLVDPLLSEFPHLSIDAQGRLRRSGNALDPIDWDLAAMYLRRSSLHFDQAIFNRG